jgi:LemA protein
MNPLYIVLGVVAVLAGYVIGAYNAFVRLRVRIKEAWSDIDVQLKRRYDLIPNLVNTVKGYAKHEREAFENVTKARAEALKGGSTEERAGKENMLTGALKSVFAIAEAYPDLKANQNFQELQRELSDTENKIQASRRFYNSNVMRMNTKVQTFPSNLIANMFGFHVEQFFELDDTPEQREVVDVKF